MVLPPTVFCRVPRLTGDVGTVIANAPPVMVNVAVVGPAEAGAAKPRPSMPVAVTSSNWEIFIVSFDLDIRWSDQGERSLPTCIGTSAGSAQGPLARKLAQFINAHQFASWARRATPNLQL